VRIESENESFALRISFGRAFVRYFPDRRTIDIKRQCLNDQLTELRSSLSECMSSPYCDPIAVKIGTTPFRSLPTRLCYVSERLAASSNNNWD